MRNKQRTMFPKESDELKHNKVFFMLASILKGMLEQQGRNANRVPKGVSKNRGKTLPDLCSVSLDEGKRQCSFVEGAFLE